MSLSYIGPMWSLWTSLRRKNGLNRACSVGVTTSCTGQAGTRSRVYGAQHTDMSSAQVASIHICMCGVGIYHCICVAWIYMQPQPIRSLCIIHSVKRSMRSSCAHTYRGSEQCDHDMYASGERMWPWYNTLSVRNSECGYGWYTLISIECGHGVHSVNSECCHGIINSV